MAKKRTSVEEQVADLLHTARTSLGLSAAFLTRMDGRTQTLEVVDTTVPLLFPEKVRQRQATSLCQAVIDGRLPAVMPDLTALPEAMRLPGAWVPRIRSYVSVPVRLSDGTLYGTFCAAGLSADKEMTDRDEALMTVLAQAASLVIEPGVAAQARETEIVTRLTPVMRAGGPTMVLQPIVDLTTGERVGAEALARFPEDWRTSPDVVFAEAHTVGLGDELELLALRGAAAGLAAVSGYVAMNVSPATLLTPQVRTFLSRVAADRIVLELSEHDQVADYDELQRVLAPLRAAGMRLAVDDVGAGFSSLRHIVVTSPDVIKLDRTLVTGVSEDGVLTALVRSLVAFARGCGSRIVAEGVETADDAARLQGLGVDYGQGWFFGRPGKAEAMRERYDVACEAAPAALPSPRPPERSRISF